MRNHIIRQELKENDAVLIVDDDMKGIYHWRHRKDILLETDEIIPFLVKHSLLAKEIGAFF